MKKFAITLVVTLLALTSLPAFAAVDVPVFDGTFVRGTGEPVTETQTFVGVNGPATITLLNGGATDSTTERVSSSEVRVNGVLIFGPSNFNQNVNSLQAEVILNDGDNSLAILLKSKPGGIVRIAITQSVNAEAAGLVGPQGGTVEDTDPTSPLYALKVEIPAGALSGSELITAKVPSDPITLPDGALLVGTPVDLEPEGLTFQTPVLITMSYPDLNNDGLVDGTAFSEEDLKIISIDNAGNIEYLTITERNTTNNTITGETNHFTIFLIIWPFVSIIPEPPAGVSAVYDNTNKWNYISWNPNSYSYKVYWGTDPGVTKLSEYGGETTDPEFTHTAVVPGWTYYYRVSSINPAGESELSEEVSVYVPYPMGSYLPDTGQTQCYDNGYFPVACPSLGEPFYGQDGNYQGPQPAYQLSQDGLTVVDLNTGLTWQQADDGVIRNWAEAVAYCENLDIGGFSDWRLPSRLELVSTVDYGRYNPAINPIFSAQSTWYLSGSTFSMVHIYPWAVRFTSGYAFFTSGANIRCVRGDPLQSGPFIDNANGTVTDEATGLMWQQQNDGVLRNWQTALSYCEELNLAGYTDWRLPNIREIQSIVDDSRYSPAISPVFSAQSVTHWSGSTGASAPQGAWRMNFNYGETTQTSKGNEEYVLCVRGGQ